MDDLRSPQPAASVALGPPDPDLSITQIGPDDHALRQRRTERIAHLCAIAVALLATAVLTGWFLDLEALKQVAPGLPTMKVNTALGLLGASVVLTSRTRSAGSSAQLAFAARLETGFALLALFLAAASIAAYALGIDLGIDELLIRDPDPASLPAPGRMSVFTALGLLLFATAALLPQRPRQDPFFSSLCVGGCIVALLALIGYAYGVDWLYRAAPTTSIALHTALCLLLLFVGLLSTRPGAAVVQLVTAHTATSALVRRLLPLVLVTPLATGWALLQLEDTGFWDDPTTVAVHSVISVLLLTSLLMYVAQGLQRREQQLARRDQLAGAMIDSSPDAILRVDGRGHVETWNARAEGLFGWPRDEAVGRSLDELLPSEDPGTGLRRFLETGDQGASSGEFRVRRRDGAELEIEVTRAPVHLDHRWTCWGSIRDLSERRRSERMLARAQRLNALGQLTGGIAHDFNNLLAVVSGNVELELSRLGEHPARPGLESALAAAERGRDLVRRLLTFAREQPTRPAPADPAALVREMRGLLLRSLGGPVEVEVHTTATPWTIHVDRSQLESAILNLVINARDAMPEGGRITIRVDNHTVDEALARAHPDARPGEHVRIRIEDQGVGMAPEILERVLEPFFSTKAPGHGTGLGMSMVYGLAVQSGGFLDIDSAADEGTTVDLYLPRHEEAGEDDAVDPASAAERAAESDAPQRPDGVNLLLLDDDAAVRRVTALQLEALGHRVVQAENADEALEALSADGALDALVSDLVLEPGSSGDAVARRARALRPSLPVLLISGYSDADLDDDTVFLPKPYRLPELSAAIREAFERAGDTDPAAD